MSIWILMWSDGDEYEAADGIVNVYHSKASAEAAMKRAIERDKEEQVCEYEYWIDEWEVK